MRPRFGARVSLQSPDAFPPWSLPPRKEKWTADEAPTRAIPQELKRAPILA